MRHISNSKELQDRIEYLENKTKQQKEDLKVRFQEAYESIKPQNLIKNVFSDAVAQPEVRNNMMNTTLKIVTGILTNKLIVGSKAGIIKRIAGTAIQMGLTKFLAKKLPAIKEKAEDLLQHRKGKKITIAEN